MIVSLTRRIETWFAAFALFAMAASAANWDDGGGDGWKGLLAKARQETPLVISGCAESLPFLAKAYKADTGIDVLQVVGDTQDITNRFRAETETGRASMDARLTGATDVDLARAGQLYPLKDLLVLPEVVNPDRWVGGSMRWVDNAQKFMVMPSQYVSTRPAINSEVIDPARVRLLADLLKPEFKGKIAAYDPTIAGSGQSAAAYFVHALGIEFVQKLFKDQQIVISTDQRQLAEWGARGLYPIILGLDPVYVTRFQDSGVKSLVIVTPQDAPGSLNGGCGVLEMSKNLAHPAGAAVFANWYLSAAGQKALVEATRFPTLRTDVPQTGVADYFIPDPKITYLDQFQEDWYLVQRPIIRDKLRTIINK